MKTKIVMITLILVLIIGLTSVFVIGTQKSEHSHKKCGSCKNFADRSVWLEKVGLPTDATTEQIINFKKEIWASHMKNINGMPFTMHKNIKSSWNFHSKGKCGKSYS